jgi:hypothetical protein
MHMCRPAGVQARVRTVWAPAIYILIPTNIRTTAPSEKIRVRKEEAQETERRGMVEREAVEGIQPGFLRKRQRMALTEARRRAQVEEWGGFRRGHTPSTYAPARTLSLSLPHHLPATPHPPPLSYTHHFARNHLVSLHVFQGAF